MPVAGAGAGDHIVSCHAHNGAVDPQSQYAYSATRSWSLDIGQPTVSAIGFAKIADALKCARVRAEPTVPAQWVKVRRHHKLVEIRQAPTHKDGHGRPLPRSHRPDDRVRGEPAVRRPTKQQRGV